ncbi:MAG: long-chain fatty acid--CoA ligase, partial [Clostridia bacterium]|nr:long-chain fatty acid--CoA ligase [Clostridia bacterium]
KMFQKMLEAPNFKNNEGMKNLLILSAGGDYISPDFVREFNAEIASQGAKGKLAPGYGLTEMCAVCTTNNVPEEFYREDTVGLPILGTHIEIWDENGNKLPAGEIGEVVMTGKCMMNRYLPDDVIHETGIYVDENGKSWVKTGDVAYLTEDGHVKFTSRIKRIIIISGYNIYPATIERKVLGLDYIAEACACQGYDENGKPYVKLVVAPTDLEADREELKEKLMAFCKDNIEGYGCPRKIVVMDALPRTKMEKIDFVLLSDKLPTE